MTYTVAGTYTTLVTLDAAIDNPTTITQTGRLTDGLQVSYQGLTLVNAGNIAGPNRGVYLFTGSSVTNQSGGAISGIDGIYSAATGVTVVNAGSVTGSSVGIVLYGDDRVTNQSGGTISGHYGILGHRQYAPVTVVNAGAITGDVDAVDLSGGFANRLVIDPGAVFSGQVDGGNTIGSTYISTLELASAGAAGTLTGLGTQFVDFAQVTVDAGAQWTLAGSNTSVSGATLTDAGTLTNAGSFSGTLMLAAGGVFSNASTGTVTALNTGTVTGSNRVAVYRATGGAATVVNAGVIAGGAGGGGVGVVLLTGGSVTNQTGGTISGRDAIFIKGGGLTLVNAGSITAQFIGIYLGAGGSVTNQSGGAISGGTNDGILGRPGGALTAVNAGTVTSSGVGIGLYGGGSVTNQSGGTISGRIVGVFGEYAPVTVVNAGTITGNGYAVQFYGGFADRLVIDPGAVFSGQVGGGNAIGAANVSTLELASAGSAGTLTGLGTQFVDFAQVTVDAGAQWTLTGSNTSVSGATLTDAGTLTNAGSFSGTLMLAAGGVLSNASTGTVTALNTGTVTASNRVAVYRATGGAATVVNAGAIAGGAGGGGVGVVLLTGGSVTNQTGGTISGRDAIFIKGGGLTLVNAGSITAQFIGIYLGAGGSVTNQSGGAISGGTNDGILGRPGGALTAVNAGTVTSSGVGIGLYGGGSVTNQSGGTISGRIVGVFGEYAPVTVVNAGTITGNGYAVQFYGGFADRLVIDPGAVFSGQVGGGNAIGAANVSTLELASAGSAGTLSGLGTQFVDFAQVTVDAGAQWTLTGSNSLDSGGMITNAGTLTLSNATLSGAAALINDGAIVLDPSNMTIASLTGSGTFTIQAGSTLDVTGVIASTETIVFAGPGASLLLGTPDSAAGSVTGFAAGDTIDLAGIAPASVSYAGGELSFTGGSFSLAATASPVIEPDGNGGTNIVACFAEGTRIATQDGSVAVEVLQAGDRVLTASGDVRPVRWIGVRTIEPARHPAPCEVQPIRIASGAFAEGVPSRDLRLSPDHAVLLHGMLIPIKLLRNDASIIRETGCRAVTYYHVELDMHDVLLAEGLAAESYLDTGNRAMFGNAGLPLLLHPDLTNDQLRREAESCAPFADQPIVVEPIWRTLAARAKQIGLVVPPMPETTGDPALHLMVDGRRCAPVSVAHGRYTFLIAGNTAEVRLVSRHAVRPDMAPWVADSRRLGVQLGAMTIRCGGAVVPVPLDHPLLAEGWWRPEWHAATTLRRWTKGDAVVPMMEVGPGPVLLEVEVAETVPYPFPSAAKEAVATPVTSMAV